MQLTINIEKRHLAFLAVLVCMLFVVGVSAIYVNPVTHVGHDANETGPGTFGGTSADTFIFPGFVRANELNATIAITLNGDRKTSWPPVVSSLPATNISAGTFGLSVGNGNFVFPNNLTVTGVAKTTGGLIIETRSSDPTGADLVPGRIWLRTS